MARSPSPTTDPEPDDALDDTVFVPPISPTQADEVRRIANRDGKLSAAAVLAEASDPDSPLHPAFEWDDTQAAHQYRLEQARCLIRKVHVVLYDQAVREFIYVPSTGSYRPVADVMASESYQAEVLERFHREADSFTARWKAHRLAATAYKQWLAEQINPDD